MTRRCLPGRSPRWSRRRPAWSNRVPTLERQLSGERWSGFYDPEGIHYGIPTYPYHCAPAGLATMRQLRAQGLRPGGQSPVAQILWRKGTRVAYLYRVEAAKPKREATNAQLIAIATALMARRFCHTCGQAKPYYIPRRYGCCYRCAGYPDMEGTHAA